MFFVNFSSSVESMRLNAQHQPPKFKQLRLLKNLSGGDISQPGSRALRRPGSSQGSID